MCLVQLFKQKALKMEALKLPKTQTGTVLKTSELPWGSLTLIEPYRGFI